jgi:hypothetical protein
VSFFHACADYDRKAGLWSCLSRLRAAFGDPAISEQRLKAEAGQRLVAFSLKILYVQRNIDLVAPGFP